MSIELRAWDSEDAPVLQAAVAESPDLVTQLPVRDLTDASACADFISTRLAATGPSTYNFAIAHGGVAVGNVGISSIDRSHDTAWAYYWVTASSRGQGLATRALLTMAAWAIDDLGLFRLELGHRLNNPGSCRVAIAAGFLPEGIERAKLRYGSDRFDVETHARLRTDPVPTAEPIPMRF